MSERFSTFLHQHKRLLTLRDNTLEATDPQGRRYPVNLVVESLQAHEGLGQDFEYTLTLLGDNAHLALKDMMGRLLAVSLTRPDGSLRWFTGHVFEFELTHADESVAYYRAVLRPWMYYTRLRRNNRVFLDKNLRAQADTILSEYSLLAAQWKWLVRGVDAPFTMAVQGGGVGESDHNMLYRRWEEAGYTTWYEHSAQGHVLMIGDDTTLVRVIDGVGPEIRYHDAAGSKDENAIAALSPVREIATTQYAETAFNFKNPRPLHVQVPTLNKQGEVPDLEVHEYVGAYGFRKEDADGDKLVRRRMEEVEARAKSFEARGNNHHVQPGRWFRLTDHFDLKEGPDSEFLVVEVHHSATNNYLQKSAAAEYSNSLVASRRFVPWRPGRGLNSQVMRVNTVQTATVAGAENGDTVDVDEYGRILVIFHWDREVKHSARVRVASNWAGGELGLVSHPRQGTEVLIQFLDGNPDHPICTAQVYNAAHMPPWALPDQYALTGLRSRELGGGGNSPGGKSSHVILDDTPGQLQLKLRSDTQASEITLGHNVRIDSTAGRVDQRGIGLEARTDGHAAFRAAKGMLITTEDRPNAQAHMTDMPETMARLTTARDVHEELAQGAQRAQAQQPGDQDEVAKAIKGQNDMLKGSGGDRSAGQFPEFQQPHLTLASPAGIEATTSGSTHVASDEHNAFTSGAHTSIAAGKSTLISARDAVRMVAFEQGIRIVSAQADIEINALKDSISIRARRNVVIEGEDISLNARNNLSLLAQNQVLVNGGTSHSTWTGSGIEHATPGVHREWAGNHSLVGPKSQPVPGTQALSGAQVLCKDCMLKALASGSGVAAV